jgi:hypothetical protein
MGLFDIFKKRKPNLDYDPNNIRLLDLQPGFILEYDMKTWIVKKVYEFGWGNNFFSYEFYIDSGDTHLVMSVEEDTSELFVTLEKQVKIRSIDPDLPETILRNEVPPRQITYNGITYLFDRESVGAARPDGSNEEWSNLISWEFYDHDNKHVLCIEQWGENDFEAYVGIVAKEHEFSNLMPGTLNSASVS